MKKLANYKSELSQCVRCGACRSTCPTLKVLRRETASARGKLSLINAYLNGEIGLSDAFVKHISECVLCGACRQSCPNNIPVPDIIMAARAEVVRDRGIPFLTSAIMKGLRESESFVGKTIKLASVAQRFIFKDVPGERGMQSRFPLPYIQDERLVPPLAKRFFLDMGHENPPSPFPLPLGERVRPVLREVEGVRGHNGFSDEKGMRIGFFAGCLINYVMPDIGLASLKVLEKAGATVIVPSGQTCCGMPALSIGDVEDAKSLALKNLEVFETYDLDFITTACATCTDGLKRRFKELLQDEGSEIKRRVESFSRKVRDISDLLINELKLTASMLDYKPSTNGTVVTYHDPCHLRRGLGIKDEPRELIEIAGFKRTEMRHPCRCCGLGGSFSITNYELSMEINRSKAEDIRSTGAEIAATACPGCMVQLRDGLHRVEAKVQVKHIVELLDERITDTSSRL